jgi:hypothetical protein
VICAPLSWSLRLFPQNNSPHFRLSFVEFISALSPPDACDHLSVLECLCDVISSSQFDSYLCSRACAALATRSFLVFRRCSSACSSTATTSASSARSRA